MTRRIALSLFTVVLLVGLTGCTTIYSKRCQKPGCSGWSDDAYAKCGGKASCEHKASCKSGCNKPCCAKKAECSGEKKCEMKKGCGPGCTKPCCAKKAECSGEMKCEMKKACKPGCTKPCCAKKAECPMKKHEADDDDDDDDENEGEHHEKEGIHGEGHGEKAACKPGCTKPCCAKKAECGKTSCMTVPCPMFKAGAGTTIFNNERNEVHHWYWGRPPIKRVHLVQTGEIGTWEYTPIWQDRLFYR